MKGFEREDRLLSLCGLNWGLCTMNLGGYCPGCGGGPGNQGCAIARCAVERGGVAYCFQCGDYPCRRYEGIDRYDSFITHLNQRSDLEKAREIGVAAYGAQQAEKVEILRVLLERYNDGRRKSFYALAVNLLELPRLRAVMDRLNSEPGPEALPAKERSALAAALLRAEAEGQGVALKPRKKT